MQTSATMVKRASVLPHRRSEARKCTQTGKKTREVGVLLAQAASSSAQRQWRSLGARSMLDARSFMISTLRSQVGFAAAVAHARLRLSRLELIGGSGRTAGR